MNDLLEAILHSPLLPEYSERIQAKLREEAERRQRFYEEITEEHKWEFIEGQVIMHSPAKNRHLFAVKHITMLASTFVSIHRLGVVHTEKCMCRFQRNDYEPDVVFFGNDKASKFDSTTMLFPPPDLVVEVLSDSTAERDRGVKFEDYERHVREYWIVDAEAEVVEQYVATDAGYELKMKAGNGLLMSAAIPGFELPVRAIFDEGANLEALKNITSAKP